MRLLMCSAYFESHRGGIEIVAGRLARELQRLGVRVTWLASDASPVPADADGAAGGRLRPVAAWNITERRLGIPLPLPGLAAVMAIWREVRAADAVLLHDSLYPMNVVAMLTARWHRKPVVLTQHIAAVPYSNPVLRAIMATANTLITRPMLAAADQIVFISTAVAGQFARVRFKAPPRLIFNGVDGGVFSLPAAGFDRQAARAALGLPTETPIALFVGRFVEKKGLHLIERLARRRPDVTFALAGWGAIDPRAWRLPNVFVLSGLEGHSLAPLYQSSDLLILPSVGEGLPLVIQEALACGLPVICGRETAAADPGAAALLESVAIEGIEPDAAADALAVSLDRILAGNGIAASSSAARERHAYVVARYGWTEAARSYISILNEVCRVGPTIATAERPKSSWDRA
jgi:glycosyltransferase involved in cell wall biosynthesis